MAYTNRERVLDALAKKETDRVPFDFWATPEILEKLKLYFNTDCVTDFLDELDIDIRQFNPDYIGPEFEVLEDGSYIDAMGINRKSQVNEFCVYEEYASFPLGYAESVKDLEKYENWPDIDKYDFSTLSDKIGDMYKTHYIKIETGGLFELAWALRGYEQFIIDMMLQPELCDFIMTKLTDYYCEYVKRAMENAGSKIDMVYTYDDIAAQTTPMMSMDTWERIIKPHHVRLNKVIKSYRKTIMYHSCGAVYDFIPRLIELPIDVLNPIQVTAKGMDIRKIKDNFGDKISFHGGVDIQYLLPSGSVDDVKAAVEELISVLGENGGYILTSAHYIQGDTPLENIIAMYEAAKNYRRQ